jgi:hypothetical protein
MADDDEHKPHHATARPPPGEEDVYSASTVAGAASEEMLAIIRGAGTPGLPADLKNEPKSDPHLKATAPPPPPLATPLEVPVTRLATVEPLPAPEAESEPPPPASAPPSVRADSAATTTDEAPGPRKGTLHPAVGIVLFFVVVYVVLAAIVR